MVRDLIEALEDFPPTARVVTGCLPGADDDAPDITYSAEFDVVRIVGSCDGEGLL
jgi:hypothetical protein